MFKQLKALSKRNPMPKGDYNHRQNRTRCPTPQAQKILVREPCFLQAYLA